MREIEYRLWHKDRIMLYEDKIGDCIRWSREGQGTDLMQYTGFKDANGKKIYEGDILLGRDGMRSEGVFFNMECGAFYAWWKYDKPFKDQRKDAFAGSFLAKDLDSEVIGNIYENPELLKGE